MILSGRRMSEKKCRIWLFTVLSCGGIVLVAGCSSTGRHVTPQLEPPPHLSSEELAHQGEPVTRPLAPDPLRFGLPPATLAVLTNDVAADMGWKEHFILQEEQEGSYTVVMSEGTTIGVQRRVSITPTTQGSEVLIFPPDEGVAARIQDRVVTYLTRPTGNNAEVSPQVKQFPLPFSQVWRAIKRTVIDGGFSFKTADEEVGFIETDRVPLGKASRSWFQGVGHLGLIARPPSMNYNYASVEWRYRIRATQVGPKTTKVTVDAVIEATPDASTLEQLTSGTLNLLSVPFGSWISSAATGSSSSRIVLPSRGRLEKEFLAGLVKKLPAKKHAAFRKSAKK